MSYTLFSLVKSFIKKKKKRKKTMCKGFEINYNPVK